MILLLIIAIICAVMKIYWAVTLIAIIWEAFYVVAFLNGLKNWLNLGIPRIGTLICGVKAVIGFLVLIWAFT